MPVFHAPPLAMNALLRMHILHAFKTGLAATITYAVSVQMGSNYSIWGVISAMMVMQSPSVTDSILASLSRFTSMSIGALAGMVLLVLTPHNNWIISAEVFLISAMGAYIGRYGMKYTIGTSAVCIVLLAGQIVAGGSVMDSIRFGVILSVEVLIGVIAAVLISAFLWPIRLGETLRSDLSRQFNRCADFLDHVVNSYIDAQTHVSEAQFAALRVETQSNQERMSKVKRLEAHIYHYEHNGLAIQVETIERFVEGMRALVDSLNEYDEESYNPLLTPEMRRLADQMIRALRHLGGDNAYESDPQIVRDLTEAVDIAETRLVELRRKASFKDQPLHRVLQLYSFYQVLRHLSGELLYALYELQELGSKPMRKKVVHPALKKY